MAGSRKGPSEALIFVIVVSGLLVFAMVLGSIDDGSERAEYRLRECVVNLEKVAIRQEEAIEVSGRYVDCPPFPDEVPGDDPVLWKVPCTSSDDSAKDGAVPRVRCRGTEICDQEAGCIDPESPRSDPTALIPACWGLLLGLDQDTMIRGQYRSEAPFAVPGGRKASYVITCRTDLTGEGTVTQYMATESKTTWMDKETAR